MDGNYLFSGSCSWFYLLMLVGMKGYQLWQAHKKDNPPADPLADLAELVKGLHVGNGELLAAIHKLLAGGVSPTPASSPAPGVIQAHVPVQFQVSTSVKPAESTNS